MLGLRRGTVKLVPYTAAWARLFAAEQARIKSVLGATAFDVQHVGSTAVAGLAAKPIIDIAIAVKDSTVAPTCVAPLAQLGYEYLGDRQGTGEHFFAKGDDSQRTHYLHVVAHDSQQWADYLRFRDRLRADSALRDEYARLKHELAAAHAADRARYTQQKAAFIQRVLADKRAC